MQTPSLKDRQAPPALPFGLKRRSLFGENSIGILIAVFIAAVIWIHVPASYFALNYFDLPKRLLWSGLAVWLSLLTIRNRHFIHGGVGISTIACVAWIVGRSIVRTHPDIELEVLASWILPGLLFFAGLSIDRDKAMKPIAWALLLSGVFQSLIMCLQYLGKDPFFPETTAAFTRLPHRMIGTIGNQNQAADVVVISCVALFYLIRQRGVRLILMLGALAVVTLTACRGAILALLGAIGLSEFVFPMLCGQRTRRWFLRLIISGSILLAITISLIFIFPQTRTRFLSPAQTLVSRSIMTKVARSMWMEKPVIGWGAGQYAFQYLDRLEEVAPDMKSYEDKARIKYVREAHNDWLQFASEFGMVGLTLVFCLFLFILHALWQMKNSAPTAVAACLFIISYIALNGLVAFPVQEAAAGPMAALLLGIMLPSGKARSSGMRAAKTSWLLLFLAIGVLAWNGTEACFNILVPLRLQQGKIEELRQKTPTFFHKHHALIGASLAVNTSYNEAVKELELAYQGYRDPVLYNNLGNVYSRLGRWDDAVVIYTKWANCGINYVEALKNLSIAHEHAGDILTAARIGEKQIRFIDCDDEGPIHRVVALYLQAGYAPEAWRLLTWYESHEIILPNSGSAEYDNLAGAVLLNIGDRMAAKDRFLSALEKKPGLVSARMNLEKLSNDR